MAAVARMVMSLTSKHFLLESFDLAFGCGGGGQNGHVLHRDGVKIAGSQQTPSHRESWPK